MWSSNRRLLLLAPLALVACGFAPAYGPEGSAAGLQGAVRLAEPADKLGFDLVERLEQRLGRQATPRFALAYDIATDPVGVGITTTGAITRYNLVGSVAYTLTDLGTGAVLSSGTVDSFTSYSATGSTVAGLEAEDDARTRLMRLLADQIVARLVASSADWLQ
ncbi:MAG: LPS assembly lipoprotein LptE [Paracoccaceae bacterium]